MSYNEDLRKSREIEGLRDVVNKVELALKITREVEGNIERLPLNDTEMINWLTNLNGRLAKIGLVILEGRQGVKKPVGIGKVAVAPSVEKEVEVGESISLEVVKEKEFSEQDLLDMHLNKLRVVVKKQGISTGNKTREKLVKEYLEL